MPDDPKTEPSEPESPPAGEKESPAREAEAPAGAAGSEPQDKFRPEAIAARINAIGDETEADRLARAEEHKLAERRREQKKGKTGLESAASKRLAKIGETAVKRPTTGLGAAVAPEADPLVFRVTEAQRWVREHGQLFGGLVTIAVLGLAGFLGFTYWQNKRNDDASALLAKVLADEHGYVSDKEADDDDEARTHELYPTFKTSADRREAALAQCRTVQSKYPGTGAAILARLSEASLLLDGGDAKASLAAYEDVKASPLAQADSEVRGRATEGIGFAHELLAQTGGEGERDKQLDAALSAYRDLAQIDVKGLKELGLYHQARVVLAKGDKAKAIDLLKEAHKLVSEPGDGHPFSYLEFVVEDRLRELDPSALPPKAMKFPGGGGAPGGAGMDDPRIQELLRKMQEQNKGGPPPLPSPAP